MAVQLTRAALNTLNSATLGTITVAQFRAIGDLLNRMPTLNDTATMANVVTTLGTVNP